MNHKVLKTIFRYSLLEQQDKIIVGFSGGADSSALLHFLSTQLPEFNLSVTACHVNHQLRGEEALRDQRAAENFCKQLGIPCRVYSVDVASVAKETGLSTEEAARNVRYNIFSALSEELGAKVATAHTLSDSMETVLMNMTRGTGLKGLAGIPPKRENIIRPLIGCTRQEIEDYCAKHQIAYVTDSTNLSDCYTRNRLRLQVLPALEAVRPHLAQPMGRMMETLRQEEDFLAQETAKAWTAVHLEKGLSLPLLKELHPAILDRVLLFFLKEQGCEQSYSTVERLSILVKEGKGSVQADETHLFSAKQALLTVCNPTQLQSKEVPYFEIPLKPGIFPLPSGKQAEIILIDCKNVKFSEKDSLLYLKSLLDYDRIKDNAVIRCRQGGDRIALAERKVSKSLKKFFNEEKIPPQERGRITLISDEEGIVWMEGYGPVQRAAVGQNTRQAVCIKITEMEL